MLALGFAVRTSLALNISRLGTSSIPNRLLFNYKVNLLKDPSALPGQAANVQSLISKYPGMEVEFLDNEGCAQAILRAHSQSLSDFFRSESFGPYKSDLCRLAQLLEKGGYYMDNDLDFVSDIREAVPADASFVSVAHPNKDIFQAFLAASPGHPLIKRTLDNMHEVYVQGRRSGFREGSSSLLESNSTADDDSWLGPEELARSWKQFSGVPVRAGEFHHPKEAPAFQKSYMLLEEDAAYFGLNHRATGNGCCCNFAVGTYDSKKAIFFSRFVGASKFCAAN